MILLQAKARYLTRTSDHLSCSPYDRQVLKNGTTFTKTLKFMNSDALMTLMRKGLHVSLGATSSLLETLQDPYKREQSLEQLRQTVTQLPTLVQNRDQQEATARQLQQELMQLSEEWAIKGEANEREARQVVETLLSQMTQAANSNPPQTVTITTTATPVVGSEVQTELQDLTNQISTLRQELETLRSQRHQNPS
jgi:polyhydroxyalkanoate synthesis regulator phasin